MPLAAAFANGFVSENRTHFWGGSGFVCRENYIAAAICLRLVLKMVKMAQEILIGCQQLIDDPGACSSAGGSIRFLIPAEVFSPGSLVFVGVNKTQWPQDFLHVGRLLEATQFQPRHCNKTLQHIFLYKVC